MRLVVLIISILLAVSSGTFPAAASRQQAQLLACEDLSTWYEPREALGGSYLANGWDNGFIGLLRITAIDGSIQGHLIEIELLQDGTYERTNLSLTGLYDSSQISLRIEGFLQTLNAIGTWSSSDIQVSWPNDDGTLSTAAFQPIHEESAEPVLELWPKHAARNVNAEHQLEMMERVADSSPFQVTAPQRVFADSAASYVAVPSRDSIDLLLMGWLASSQFSEHDPQALPNQTTWYDIHTFSQQSQALQAASCYQGENFFGESHRDESFPYGAIVDVDFLPGQTANLSITTVTAVHGSNLITARIYGEAKMADHGLGMVQAMIEDIGGIH